MSLINQMLKDLESRRVEREPDAALEGTILASPPEEKDFSLWKIWAKRLLALLLMISLAVLLWQFFLKKWLSEAPNPITYIQQFIKSKTEPKEPIVITPPALPAEEEPLDNKALEDAIETVPEAPISLEPTIGPPLEEEQSVEEELVENPVVEPPKPAPAKKVLKVQPVISSEEESEQAYSQGLQLAERQQYSAAVKELSKSLSLWSSNHRAREALVSLQIKRGFNEQAKQLLEQGLQINPSYLAYIKLKARLYLMEKNTSQAIDILEKNKNLVGQDLEYQAFMAATYQQAGQHDQAANLYHTVLEMKPQASNWRMGLGISLEALGKRQEALEAYSQALNAGGLNPAALQYVRERIRALKEE